jgi:hypothetical protein
MDKVANTFKDTSKAGDIIKENKIQIKVSAIINMDLLKKLNSALVRMQDFFIKIDSEKNLGYITYK